MTTVLSDLGGTRQAAEKIRGLICQTQKQARQQLANIKSEFETNDLLKNDLGPFAEYSDEWGIWSLVLKNQGRESWLASTEQSIQRHKAQAVAPRPNNSR